MSIVPSAPSSERSVRLVPKAIHFLHGSRRQIQFGLVLLAEFGFVSADAQYSFCVHLIVHAHVAVGIEQQADLIPPEFPVRLAHDDVVGARAQIRCRAGTVGHRFRPDEFPAQNWYHVFVGLHDLHFVARFAVDDFVIKYFAPQHY